MLEIEIENLNAALTAADIAVSGLEKTEAEEKAKIDAGSKQMNSDMESLSAQLAVAVKAQHDAETALVDMVPAAAMVRATESIKALEARITVLTAARA